MNIAPPLVIPSNTPLPIFAPRNYTGSCPTTNDGYIAEVISMVNAERNAAGLTSLDVDWTLVSNSLAWSIYMATNNYFGHSGQNVGENVAAGQLTASTVISAWMNSDGHRAKILNSSYTQIGAGYAYCADTEFGSYWTLQFR
jgi:uncharacterized protein YkwD